MELPDSPPYNSSRRPVREFWLLLISGRCAQLSVQCSGLLTAWHAIDSQRSAKMAGAWFLHWTVRPMRPVWPVRGLYRPDICTKSESQMKSAIMTPIPDSVISQKLTSLISSWRTSSCVIGDLLLALSFKKTALRSWYYLGQYTKWNTTDTI